MKELGYVFAFTSARPEVVAFYREILALDVAETKDDAAWFRTEGARFSVQDDDDRQTTRELREAHVFVIGIGMEVAFDRHGRDRPTPGWSAPSGSPRSASSPERPGMGASAALLSELLSAEPMASGSLTNT